VAPELEIGDELDSLVASLLATRPEERPSAADAAREIARCLDLLDDVKARASHAAHETRLISPTPEVVAETDSPAHTADGHPRPGARHVTSLIACALVGYTIAVLFVFAPQRATSRETGAASSPTDQAQPPTSVTTATTATTTPEARPPAPPSASAAPAPALQPLVARPLPRLPEAPPSAAAPPLPPRRSATVFSTSN
jgi:hypothetical protein